jgi:hypothetical protein
MQKRELIDILLALFFAPFIVMGMGIGIIFVWYLWEEATGLDKGWLLFALPWMLGILILLIEGIKYAKTKIS